MADRKATIWKFLRGKGLSPAQTAGVVGSLMGESGEGLSTTAVNPSSGAYGIAQWLGGRKTALMRRQNPQSLNTQLNHLWSELQGPERAAYQRLKGAHSIDDAVSAWTLGFERPGAHETTLGRRNASARGVFNQLQGVGGGGGGGGTDPGGTRTTTTTTPGVDNRAARGALVQSFLDDDNADVLNFAMQARELKDVAPTSTKSTERLPGAPGGRSGPASESGEGAAKITGPNPGRIQPGVKNFMRQISAVRGGKPVVGSDGTGHSKLTVNGNVSDHFAGNATDIPAAGSELINLGQAALIAAGMPRAQARKQRGGLYNVNGHQIIFATNEGGNHHDHLHISARGR